MIIVILAIYVVSFLCVFIIGAIVGKAMKGRALAGFVMAALLGPLGILLMCLFKDLRPKCCHCGGVITKGVSVCRHCGRDLIDASKERDRQENGNGGKAVNCPFCGGLIRLETLKPGKNRCPHCDKVFVCK